jgi:hypothetical protein
MHGESPELFGTAFSDRLSTLRLQEQDGSLDFGRLDLT